MLASEHGLICHDVGSVATGRFVNRDPVGDEGGINLYGDVVGNPINRNNHNGTQPPLRSPSLYAAPILVREDRFLKSDYFLTGGTTISPVGVNSTDMSIENV